MSKKAKIITFTTLPLLVLVIIFAPRWFHSSPDLGGGTQSTQQTPQPALSPTSALPVNVYVARTSHLSRGIQATGSLVANEEVELTSESAGKVIAINFQEGSHVKKGDLLIKINDDDLIAQLERAQFQLKLLTEQLERQRILLEKDAVSRESFDKVQTDYNMVASDISLYKARIEKTEVKASFGGVVGFRYVSDGSFVQPGTKIARLVDNSSLKVEFFISEKYVSLPLLGSDILFTVEGFSQKFRAKVYAVDPKIDLKTRMIALRAQYKNENELLLPGMSAYVTLITSQSANAIQIPTEAVIPEMNGKSVWIVRNGIAVAMPIQTGVRSDLMIEVTQGIAMGDTVVTTGLMQLRAGMPVAMQQVE
ncbi:MAG: efflux RND transporter periplasmic adaptor subunit [Prevotellaceae bacterium]|jgi:membrane fusion protein (multidrug efflux system)|nr:efflux RND transporter periplasmic adaptor subunit [Prevotellaceae bacterium]